MLFWLVLLSPSCFGAPRTFESSDEDGSSMTASNTLGYRIASEMLLKSINFSADPCVDFFEFTCGNWIDTHPIPSHESSYSLFGKLSHKVKVQMRDVFESSEMFASKSVNALKLMYRKCMDKNELTKTGSKRLLQTIRKYGVWPMIDGDDKFQAEYFDLTSLMIHVTGFREVDVFVAQKVTLDNKNVLRRLFQFDQAELGLGESTRDYYLDRVKHGKKIEAYRQLLIDKVKLINEYDNRTTNDAKIAKDVDEIIDFETEIAKIMVAEEDRRNSFEMYNLKRLSEFQKLMPVVNWTRYFNSVAPSSVLKYFEADPDVLIKQIDYIGSINELLLLMDPRIITNYMFIIFASAWSGELGERFADISQKFHRVMYGRKQKVPTWKVCTSSTMHRLQYATGAIYVSKAYDKATKNIALDMVSDLNEVFNEMLVENDWMDNATKNAAFEKANAMLRQIAYPDFILDSKKLDDYYRGFSVGETDSYSQMIEKLSRWRIECEFKRLIKPVDRTEYDFNPADVDAYYSHDFNSIKIPAAILQAPFFHPTFPRALNYGGIGVAIGHEITHGFDDHGSQFDADGNLRDWWDADVKKKFIERAQCIIDQYGKIRVPGTGLNVNGKLTQGENIADNGGVKQALRAYRKYLMKHGEEKRVEGLEEYSNEQMFFMGYALTWCAHSTKDALIKRILTDPHPPQHHRINQVLANQPEFAQAFNCTVGTPMNPTERCAVW
uniref:Neprilysin n=2 Tax=Haemonchus contortus TaxID=6289 RepID=A0A7I4Y525_HAECO